MTNLMEMVLASDHGHAGRQVSDHVVSSLPQPVLLMVEGKVFLDQLLAGRHRDLHCSVDHGWRNILKKNWHSFRNGQKISVDKERSELALSKKSRT